MLAQETSLGCLPANRRQRVDRRPGPAGGMVVPGSLVYPGAVVVRPLLSEAPRLAATVAAAMFEDPLHCFFIPDPQRRQRLLPHLYAFGLRHELRLNRVYANSAALEGVVIWEPPGRDEGQPGSAVLPAMASLFEGLGLAGRLGVDTLLRMLGYLRFAAAERRRHAPCPHWYLSLLAVRPDCQGQGHAGALVRPMLQRADREGLPCYLETQNERNLPVYAHFGFEVAAEALVPGSPVRQWSMLRSPC
jgi:GNAT superfamily N-acetyltransferase